MLRAALLLTLLALTSFAGACAGITGRSAARAAPEVVRGSLQELDTPASQETIGHILTSPEIQEGARQLAMSVAGGAFDQLSAEEQQALIDHLARVLASTVVAGSLESALATLSEGRNHGRLVTLVNDVARSAAAGVLDEVAARVGPEEREQAAQAWHGAMRDFSQAIAQGIAGGVSQAVEANWARQGIGPEESIFAKSRLLVRRGTTLTTLLAVGLPLLLLLLLGLLLLRRRGRRRKAVPAPVSTPVAVSPEALAPAVAQAVRDMLRDPATRRLIVEELRRTGPHPPEH